MKDGPFEVGDKVVLSYPGAAYMATVPKLVPGRVYCVEKITISTPSGIFAAHQRLHLCGVRLSKRLRNPKPGMPFSAFRRVGSDAKEAA